MRRKIKPYTTENMGFPRENRELYKIKGIAHPK